MEHYIVSYITNKNKGLYKKDPISSELGKNILRSSLEMISLHGLDEFTFKKLATLLNSSEASIYRYFDNKFCLGVYLCNLYWAWLEYEIMFSTLNLENNMLKINNLIASICKTPLNNIIDLNSLSIHNVVIREWKKLLQHNWGGLNPAPFFTIYTNVIERISTILNNCNQSYLFPTMLSNTLIETSLFQKFNTKLENTLNLNPYLTQLTLATLYTK